MVPDSSCPLCGGKHAQVVGTADRDGRPLRNVLCRDCGLVYVDPQPARTDLQTWYEHAYRQDYKGVAAPKPRHVLRGGRVALSRLARIRPLLTGVPRTLDVGSGSGELLYLLTHLAGARAEGLEPHRGYATHARDVLGLPVRHGFVDDPDTEVGEGYDLVTMYHVLEHLAEPQAVMRWLHGRVRPGGFVMVEVPNVEATCQSPAHTFHRAHIATWGGPTLERLGLQAGLRPVASATSADGGNVDVLFVRDADAPAPDPSAAASRTEGYADRVAAVLRGHTMLRHHLSWRPLVRTARRTRAQLDEHLTLGGARDPRAILDALVAQARASGAAGGGWPAPAALAGAGR